MVNIFLTGRLTADPTITENNGRTCCNFSVAAKTRRKGDDGEYIADFYRVAVWGAQADACSRYLSRGSMVAVSGSADQSPYLSNHGEPRSGMQINASNVEFLSAKTQRQNSRADEEDMFS